MSYRKRLLRLTIAVFIGFCVLQACGVKIMPTWNGHVTFIGAFVAALLCAVMATPKLNLLTQVKLK